MTTQEKIEQIRATCIEANPNKCIHNGKCLDGASGIHCSEWEENQLERPIRLADILLVLGAPKIFDNLEHCEWALYGLCIGHFPKSWNLHQDDLTQQSPECIDFLYSLLFDNPTVA